jgi:glycosyltransferase involved in cell wall biosynthesis
MTASGKPLRLMFASMNTLLDPSNGAAISVRTLLEMLAARGVEAMTLTATCFDRAVDNRPLAAFEAAGFAPQPTDDPDLMQVSHRGVSHHLIMNGPVSRAGLTREVELAILDRALVELDRLRPDAVIVFGGSHFELGLQKELRQRGIASIFYLANPGYKTMRAFENVDLIFTDTVATRDRYRATLGLQPTAIGKFVEKPKLPTPAPRGKYVTFVNPAPEKGVTLFFRIAELASQLMPSTRFLVVESRGSLEATESRTGLPFSKMRNVHAIGLQNDMSTVFSLTKVLLFPSLWHESGPRTPIEACSLGIPIVASDTGGIPEVLGDAPLYITPPEPLLRNHKLIPPLSEAIPWVEALRMLLTDPAFYEQRRAASLEQWTRHDPEERLRSIVEEIEKTIARRRGAA